MAARGHTPYWRNDAMSANASARSLGGMGLGGMSTSGLNDNEANTMMGGTGENSTVGVGEATSNLGMVFGWDISHNMPAPDMTNSLLDQSENDLMNTFFDDPNNFTAFDFGMDQKDNPLSHFNFDIGTDSTSNPFNFGSYMSSELPTSFHPSLHSNTSSGPEGADVHAASYLMNMSSQIPQPNNMVNSSSDWPNLQATHGALLIPADDKPINTPQQLAANFNPDLLSSGMLNSSVSYGNSAMPRNPNVDSTNYGSAFRDESANPSEVHSPVPHRPVPFAFGTDNNFGSQGYQGAGSVGNKAKEQQFLNLPLAGLASKYNDGRNGGFMGQQTSNTSSRPNANHLTSPSGLQNSNLSQWVNDKRRQTDYMGQDEEDQPQSATRKRRKSTIGDDEDFETGRYGSTTPVKRPKSRHNASSTPVSSASSPGADNTSLKKKARENKSRPNLSESQKRENHIISEQKRRNVIKQAFGDLNDMVPSLQGGKSGLSKAEILREVVTFVEHIVEGNRHMAEVLRPYGPAPGRNG